MLPGTDRTCPMPDRRSHCRDLPRRPATLAALLLLAGCAAPSPRLPPIAPPSPPTLTVEQSAMLIDAGVADRAGWAADSLAAIAAIGQPATLENVCQVLAVVEQESGFRANPAVHDLAGIVRRELDQQAKRFGPLGPPAVRWLLAGKAPGESRSFEQRLAAARTEADVDRVFRQLVTYWREQAPLATAVASLGSRLFADRPLEALNPITTAGSMQVAVRFAVEHAAPEGKSEATVREELYTRAGGLRYGVARLLGYEASYDRALYRFADFNAGPYAARNAAMQEQLAKLLGISLALDGDLLIYDPDGRPSSRDSQSLRAFLAMAEHFAPELSELTVRRDLRREKSEDFETTDTYRTLRKVVRARTGQTATYARLPELVLHSPKLSRERTTEWFARNVDRRYQRCLERGKPGATRR